MKTKIMIAGFSAAAAIAAVTGYFHNSTAILEKDLMEAADYEFIKFVSEHGRSYATVSEFNFRSKVFKDHLVELEAFNSKNGSSTVGVNFLSDRTPEEKKKLNGFMFNKNRVA